MEEASQRMLSWRTASVWPTVFSALHTISRPLSSGDRLERVRVRVTLLSVSDSSIWKGARASERPRVKKKQKKPTNTASSQEAL